MSSPRAARPSASSTTTRSPCLDGKRPIGGYDEEGISVVLYAPDCFRRPDSTLTHILTHELGHLLYLPHNDRPASIMYPKMPSQTYDDAQTIAPPVVPAAPAPTS